MSKKKSTTIPVGAIVYLPSSKELLMTVTGNSPSVISDEKGAITIGVTTEVAWFDEDHNLHRGSFDPRALKVRVLKPKKN